MLKHSKGSVPLALFLSVARPVGLMDEIPFGQTKKKKCFSLSANAQEQLAIKAASAYNCPIKPASASAWPLSSCCYLAFYRAFYPSLQPWLEASHGNLRIFLFVFFFFSSKDVQQRDIKVASLCFRADLALLLFME